MILENITSPRDVRGLNDGQLSVLIDELRQTILETVSKNGGHLSSNLGVVELTVALHRVFDSPQDKIIFDVGHQSYVHKLLTGRNRDFATLRKKDGISGFMNREESEHDVFGSGHSSNSVSLALGIANANKLDKKPDYAIAVVGDGAFTGGMIYEALNNCDDKDLRLIIVLNDNEMSISQNVGAINNYFSRFRTSVKYFRFRHSFVTFFGKVPVLGHHIVNVSRSIKNKFKRFVLKENFFELLDLDYYGPLNGNDEKALEQLFNEIKNRHGGITVVHICTKKGKGYPFSESEPDTYHSVGSFDLSTGVVPNGKERTFSYNAGKAICSLAESDARVCAITAAMTGGTGLDCFAKRFGDRFFDVGIAEEHAVTFAAGLAAAGKKPVFAVYSTFLQRCYDQLLSDSMLQKLPVILAIDRAGIVGDDGATHHGVFDVSLLATIPGMTVFSPDSTDRLLPCFEECMQLLSSSAVRYPRGKQADYNRSLYKTTGFIASCDYGIPEAAIITYGRITESCDKAASMAFAKGIGVRVIRIERILPLPSDELIRLVNGISTVIFAEEGIQNGGLAEMFGNRLISKNIKLTYKIIAINNCFVPHGNNLILYDDLGFSPDKLLGALEEMHCKSEQTH